MLPHTNRVHWTFHDGDSDSDESHAVLEALRIHLRMRLSILFWTANPDGHGSHGGCHSQLWRTQGSSVHLEFAMRNPYAAISYH
eukprot:6463981-Amphidinium_carterae.1